MASPTILRDLEDRITHLERQLADTAGADNLQPNVLSVNADGSITATVAGVIVAQPGSSVPASSVTGQLTSAQIQTLNALQIVGQLTDNQIAALAAAKINGQLTDAQIAQVAAGKVTGQLTDTQIAQIAAGKITGQLSDAQISALNATKITGQIGTTQITPGSITTALLAANAVVAASIAAGAIDGKTITGALIQTSAANPRVAIDASGLKATDATGAIKSSILADGSGSFSGHIAAKGVDLGAYAGPDYPKPDNEVRWIAADGALAAEVYGARLNSGSLIFNGITAQADYVGAGAGAANGDFGIYDTAAKVFTGLHTEELLATGTTVQAVLRGTKTTIIDRAGASDFLKVPRGGASPSPNSVTFPPTFQVPIAANARTALLTVNHGASFTPLKAFCSVPFYAAGNLTTAYADSFTPTQMRLIVQIQVPAAAGTIPVDCILYANV